MADRLPGAPTAARTGYLVARLGGDEFALLVEDSTGTDQLADLAESVLKALQPPFDLAGQRLSVSASHRRGGAAGGRHHRDRL